MRYSKLAILAVIVIFLFTMTAFAATKKATAMGRYPFAKVRHKLPPEKNMKMLADKYAKDINKGFVLAGNGDLVEPFMEQLKQASFTEKQINPGEKFQWMLYRVNGKIKLVRDLEWAGKKPLDVYSFMVAKDSKNYEIVLPKPCFNISLLNVTDIVPPVPPPVCDLKVSPAKVNVNDPVTVDMSGCQYATTMEVTVYDSENNKIASQTLSPENPKWETKFDKPGDYVFKAKAVNQTGEASGPNCEAKVHVNHAPTCQMKASCTMCKHMVGKPITLDCSGSTDSDGEIVKAKFEVTDSTGKVVDSYEKTGQPLTWEKTFDTAGVYTITATVYDDMGASAGGAEPCKIQLTVTERKILGVLEAGPMLCKGTYTGFIFARGGILYKIKPKVADLIFTVGGAGTTVDGPWKTFFMLNAIVNYHATETVFIGGGLGYSTAEHEGRKDGIDLIFQGGVVVYEWNPTTTASIFGELRAPIITSDRSFDDHHKLLLGVRFTF